MLAITNGKILTITGQTYERGTVLMDGGRILAVGGGCGYPGGDPGGGRFRGLGAARAD